MRKVIRRLIIAACAVGALAAIGLWATWSASRRAPAFYRQALAASPEALAENGQQFERTALELHNQLQLDGHWQVSITQDEINGWLASDLPAKFPRVLPPGASEPRIAIDDGEFRLAVHYRSGGVDTVLSLAGEAYLTAQPNELAVRLVKTRAGLLPVPLERLIQEISAWSVRADFPLRWTEVRGAPVALVRLPLELDDEGKRRVVLDRLNLSEGKLFLAGRTQDGLSPDGDTGRPIAAGQPGEKETRQR